MQLALNQKIMLQHSLQSPPQGGTVMGFTDIIYRMFIVCFNHNKYGSLVIKQ
jgi:hypothetical protein